MIIFRSQYNPLYPHPGSLQHVVGILSPTHSGAIDALADFFPSLADIDPTRLSLTLLNAAQSESGSDQKNKPWKWAVLTSGVWPSVVADPPERLGVVLGDLPEEEAKRECDGVLLLGLEPARALGLIQAWCRRPPGPVDPRDRGGCGAFAGVAGGVICVGREQDEKRAIA